ncbi:hypothetical protein B0H14DRAFT_2612097 [Mycena olivaceomarginata]|nr:hypothetical protein B0H14DRAFT_2612097 [Mycena olivaceomarginata]
MLGETKMIPTVGDESVKETLKGTPAFLPSSYGQYSHNGQASKSMLSGGSWGGPILFSNTNYWFWFSSVPVESEWETIIGDPRTEWLKFHETAGPVTVIPLADLKVEFMNALSDTATYTEEQDTVMILEVAIAWADSIQPDSAQDAAPTTDATPLAKKADKDKEKLKKKDKVASENEVVQEIEYEDNGNGSDDDNSKSGPKHITTASLHHKAKKVVMVTAAPKAGLSGSPNIAIAKKAQHAPPVHNGEKLPYEVWPAYA